MPQEQNILKCFSCETFQVHIVKKARKWECKMCGVKQSFKRQYGRGTGKECRLRVQTLNETKITKDITDMETSLEHQPNLEWTQEMTENIEFSGQVENKKTSKWDSYLDIIQSSDDNEDNINEMIPMMRQDRATYPTKGKNKGPQVKPTIQETQYRKKTCHTETTDSAYSEGRWLSAHSAASSNLNILTCDSQRKQSTSKQTNHGKQVRLDHDIINNSNPVSYGKYGKYMDTNNMERLDSKEVKTNNSNPVSNGNYGKYMDRLDSKEEKTNNSNPVSYGKYGKYTNTNIVDRSLVKDQTWLCDDQQSLDDILNF